MKKLIPSHVRVRLRVLYSYLFSIADGSYFKFTSVKKGNRREGKTFKPQLTLTQPIRKTSYSSNKLHNLKVAGKSIQNLVIQPGNIFSFWHIVGAPTSYRDFKVGRTIIGSELNTSVGGGLCQIAGIIYYLGLAAGWEIIERHAHSLDLYNDKTRYTPLGADASVFYGYKDLRMKNTSGVSISIQFEIAEDYLSASFCANQPISTCDIEFLEKRKDDMIYVKTLRFHPPAWEENLGISSYKTYEVEENTDEFMPKIPEKSPLSKEIEQQALREWSKSEIISQ